MKDSPLMDFLKFLFKSARSVVLAPSFFFKKGAESSVRTWLPGNTPLAKEHSWEKLECSTVVSSHGATTLQLNKTNQTDNFNWNTDSPDWS